LIGAVDYMKVCDNVAAGVKDKPRALAKLKLALLILTYLDVHHCRIGNFVQLYQPITQVACHDDLSRELKIVLRGELGDRNICGTHYRGAGGQQPSAK
jgi:hypothetical protein